MNKGYKEALGAVLAAIALAAIIGFLLSGCTRAEVLAKYSHRSSIPDYRDRNTSDTVGACVAVTLGKSCGRYCPEMEGCVNYEVSGTPTYGRDPSGEISIRQPVKIWE